MYRLGIRPLIVLAFVFGLSTKKAIAQNADPENGITKNSSESGRSLELSDAFKRIKRPEYVYVPVDIDFWKKYEKCISDKQYDECFDLINKQLTAVGKNSPQGLEALVARAGLFQIKGLAFGAYDIYFDVAKKQMGSALGEFCLRQLSFIVQDHEFDKEELMTYIDANEFGPMHPDVVNFISFYKALTLLKYGFGQWAKELLQRIEPESYFGIRLKYLTSISMVASGQIDKAEALLEELYKKEMPFFQLKNRITLQLARLYFEKGMFEQAYGLYQGLKGMPVREQGRVLLEKAWTKFYLGDYGRAMGHLHAMKAPFFTASHHFETYILEMLIYRKLCHYDAVTGVSKAFEEKYKSTLNRIRGRSTLTYDKELFVMAALDNQIQMQANLISKLHDEINLMRSMGWEKYSFYKDLFRSYKTKDRQIQLSLEKELQPRIEQMANELLRAYDQIQFVTYKSSLDKLNINEGQEKEKFKSEEISSFSFEKVFWPTGTEYWYDEMDNYTMKISSKCLVDESKKSESSTDDPPSKTNPDVQKGLDPEDIQLDE